MTLNLCVVCAGQAPLHAIRGAKLRDGPLVLTVEIDQAVRTCWLVFVLQQHQGRSVCMLVFVL